VIIAMVTVIVMVIGVLAVMVYYAHSLLHGYCTVELKRHEAGAERRKQGAGSR
jgi:Tfp pilus assembly protein PilV